MSGQYSCPACRYFLTLVPASVSFLFWFHQARLDRSKNLGWKLRFSIRALKHFKHSRAWISYVREVIAPKYPEHAADLFQQSMKPFYCHRFDSRKVNDMLVNAHRLSANLFGDAAYDRMLAGQRIELCRLSGLSAQYKIYLELSRIPSRESVLSLKFACEDCELTELGFFFDAEGGETICRVGVLQTLHINANLQKMRCASKDLHYVHPRALLVKALRKLCEGCEVARIEGISSQNHIWSAPRYKLKNNAKSMKYDEMWKDFGGRIKPDGNFDLPVTFTERPLSSYPQKKWNLVRKKQKLLESLKLSISFTSHQAAMTFA